MKSKAIKRDKDISKNIPKVLIWLQTVIVLLCGMFFLTPLEVWAEGFRYTLDTDGELIIVIDPGHGGGNLGADYNGFLEKEMNMTVANAMYEELSKYEDITVYMTHTDVETDMSIKERAEFANSVNADFVFCLHFNMSPDNKLFGSEVWVSAFGEENREGYRFSCVQMETMEDMGLFLRGVKTRFNDKGTDYYGILRYCEEYDIPAALIEHCHIDHATDVGFCDSEEDLIAFGIADATSVAKYFGLSSEELGVDYSDYELMTLTPGSLYVQADTSDPDICMIEKKYEDMDRDVIGVTVTATDYDSPMLYYSYSIDGGLTYTPYLPWPETDVMAGKSPDTFTFEIAVPDGTSPAVKVRAINQYDRYTESNLLEGYPVFVHTPEEVPVEDTTALEETTDTESVSQGDVSGNGGFKAPERPQEEEEGLAFGSFLKLCVIVVILILFVLLISNLVTSVRRSQRRKKRRRK